MTDTHDGGCACGAIRYRVCGEPIFGTVCHCTFCQRRLASAFAVMATFPEESVQIIRGEPADCEHRSDVSGRWLRMSFCRSCGTTVSHSAEIRPGMRTVAAGTFDDPRWFRVDRHIWVQSKLPWVSIPAGVERHEQAYVAQPPPTSI